MNGIYYSIGPHDLWEQDYQNFAYTWSASSTENQILKDIDGKINTDDTKIGAFSSISKDSDTR